MLIDKKHIGMKVPPHSVTPTAWQLKWFAKATGESNPIYFDEAAAAEAGLPGVLVPPTFFFCMDMDKDHPFDYLETMGCDLGKMLHGEQSFVYHKPVNSGEKLDFDVVITDSDYKKNGALRFVVKDVRVRLQRELVCDVHSVMVIRA
ncbi:MAG: MaoC family dehydratase [Elusimicrobia bacterium]|nr:MAG: MaoC family dehydratase [Elusimicrobiota bacterium]